MSSRKLIGADQAEPVLYGEVLETDENYLQAVYADSGIEDDLARYLNTGLGFDSNIAELGLSRFCGTIAGAAWKYGEIDVAVVRSGFDIVTASMNEVASHVHGYTHQSAIRALLIRAGITGVKSPQADSYVRVLDEQYWSSQFMDEFKSGGLPMTPRHAGETDSDYFPRYTYGCMKGFLFAPFTYLAKPVESSC